MELDSNALAALSDESGKFQNLTSFRRCLCQALIPTLSHSKRCYSGLVNYDVALCDDCTKNFADYCRIVCLACRSLQGFLKPYRAVDGFVYERGKHYHIYGCPRCDSSITATPVLEHERFRIERLGRSEPDRDLVQEIEQKNLRAQREIDTLRASLQLDPL